MYAREITSNTEEKNNEKSVKEKLKMYSTKEKKYFPLTIESIPFLWLTI